MSEQATEITPEVQAAYEDLLVSFRAFLEAFGAASAVGIDAGAAVSQNLKSSMSAEDWEAMPPMLKMLLG